MSGFVCIAHADNSPIDTALLHSLTNFLSFRGPDGQSTWADHSIGMGHALLRTSYELKNETQPLSLEGRYWIVADVRLDSREELIAELLSKGQAAHASAPDCELILAAYAVWGDACVDHLRGDFSFAIWDKEHKKLFCARDHFGVKPFYYASVGSLLVLSNTLNCIRRHPAVPDGLNDLAIADFLLFDMIREPGATSFADIRRLPPAHVLVWQEGSIAVRRYWTLPVSEPLHHKRPSDCVEQFRELLDRAVADRLRSDRVGVLMSGGLDSPTVAASAKRILSRNGNRTEVRAYTDVFERLIPHEERHYATLVAEALKIPIEFQVSDETGLPKYLHHQKHYWPEPRHLPSWDGGLGQLGNVADKNRVALTGFGGDPALSCLLSVHFSQLLKIKKIGLAVAEALRYIAAEGRFSRLYIRTRLQRWFPSKSHSPHYPLWLRPCLEKRLSLRERWKTFASAPVTNGTARRTAYEAIIDPFWPDLFEGYDPGATRIPVEVRHPFFDIRLASFLLALPALPWCSDKELLREAARGVLPDTVRLRRKSPLLAEPLIALLQRPESAWVDAFEAVAELGEYVEKSCIPKVFRTRDVWGAWIHLRPLSLNFWLRARAATG